MRVAGVRTGVLVALGTGALAWALAPAPIAGTVVDTAGHPVDRASVAVTSLPLGRPTRELTDSAGTYSLVGYLWPAGRAATVTAPGFRPVRTGGGRVVLHRWPWISGMVTDDV